MASLHVLVTGGAGFIGSHVADRLLARGHRVRIVDDFSTGRRANVPAEAELIEGTLVDPRVVDRAVGGVDRVVHLAAIASVERSVREPLATHAVNLGATIALAEAMAERGVRRVVYASSAAVYGAVERDRHGEDAPPDPRTPYAIDKLAGERYLAFFADAYGLQPRPLRFFNVYGPRQDPASPYSGVIGIFADRLADGRPLRVHGDGRQTRDFVFVGDVVDVIVRHVEDEAPTAMGPMNVGTGRRTSLLDLIAALEGVVGTRADVRHEGPRPGDLRHSTADVARLRAWRGEVAPTPLSAGLAGTVAWLRGTHEGTRP